MNLLPQTEKEILKKGLKLRFLILTSFLISASFLLGLVMLLPAYFLTSGNLSRVALENYSSEIKNENSVEATLSLPEEVNSKLKFLQSNNGNASAVDTISQIIKYLPTKVKLDSISFSREQSREGKSGVIILISGIAADRNSLISFSTFLKESNSFSSVEMPVSSLTRDKDLPFSMNIFIEN